MDKTRIQTAHIEQQKGGYNVKGFIGKVIVSAVGGIAAFYVIRFLEVQTARSADNVAATERKLQALGQ